MLSANAIVVVAGAVMIVIVVVGRARGASNPTIVARCALLGAVGWILALTIFPISVASAASVCRPPGSTFVIGAALVFAGWRLDGGSHTDLGNDATVMRDHVLRDPDGSRLVMVCARAEARSRPTRRCSSLISTLP